MVGFEIHHTWTFTFGLLGNLVSVFVYLAPLPTFKRIYREKSTMEFDSLPYAVAIFSSMLWMYYAFLKKNALLLISINSFGCIIEAIYISMFLFYASKNARNQMVMLLGLMCGVLFLAIFLVSLFILEGNRRLLVVGWISVAVSVIVFAAPIRIALQVVRTRSVEFMPILLSFFLTLSAVMWFAYGLSQRDLCIALPNVLGFLLGMLQMLLYQMFRKAKPVTVEKKLPEHVLNIIMQRTPEVHQVDSQKSGSDEDEIVQDEENCTVPRAINLEPCNKMNIKLDSPILIVCPA